MGVQQSSKQGVQSDSQKRDRARYIDEQAPDSAPVAGAFGREQGPEDLPPGGSQEPPIADRATALAQVDGEEPEDDEDDDDEYEHDDDYDDEYDDEDDEDED